MGDWFQNRDWKVLGWIIGALAFIVVSYGVFSINTLNTTVETTAERPINVKVDMNWDEFPTPAPTHTPQPTPTATPRPHDTPTPDQPAFLTAVTTGTTLAAGDVSITRVPLTQRYIDLPICRSAVAADHPREYFWILTEPQTTQFRELLDGDIDTLNGTIWTQSDITLTIDGRSRDLHAYRTTVAEPCGDSLRTGLGGARLTFTIGGH